MKVRSLLQRLARDSCGTMIIETAIVAPVLVLLSLGAYQVSTLVARQSELQSAMGMAESVALASAVNTEDKRTTLKNIIAASTGLAQSQITVSESFRCNWADERVTATSYCTTGDKVSTYVNVSLVDSFEPVWRDFGIGSAIPIRLDRQILIEQKTKL